MVYYLSDELKGSLEELLKAMNVVIPKLRMIKEGSIFQMPPEEIHSAFQLLHAAYMKFDEMAREEREREIPEVRKCIRDYSAAFEDIWKLEEELDDCFFYRHYEDLEKIHKESEHGNNASHKAAEDEVTDTKEIWEAARIVDKLSRALFFARRYTADLANTVFRIKEYEAAMRCVYAPPKYMKIDS